MSRIPPEFKVTIPEDRTALYPTPERDKSKLLVVDRAKGVVFDAGVFSNIIDYISGDLLVLNETRVIPAAVEGRKPGGGKLDLLFLKADPAQVGSEGRIQALIKPGRRLRPGLRISLLDDATFQLEEKTSNDGWEGTWRAGAEGDDYRVWLEKFGQPPLPPYIRRRPEQIDHQRYSTVYANHPGSLAAPTAGFHFTQELLDNLSEQGCDLTKLSLNIGLGTFQPIRSDDLSSHSMHKESYHIPVETAETINREMSLNRKLTVVGTTVVRALEHRAQKSTPLTPGADRADIFIHPPYKFRIVNRLITNFHRPDSTLIQLTAALTGWDLLNLAYQSALDRGFRFFSYGDAMLII